MKPPFAASLKDYGRFFLMAWALPAVLSYFVYYAVANPYSGNVFFPEGFAATYDHGIFKYRILGINLLRATHELIVTLGLPTSTPQALHKLYPETTAAWYSAFFYLNVAVLGVTMSIYYVIMDKLNKTGRDFFADLGLMLLLGIMIYAQYVIVPYDMLSYMFQAGAIYLILFRPGRLDTLVLLCAIIILGTLTRETAALILSFYAAVNFKDLIKMPPRLFEAGASKPSPLLTLVILTAAFLGTYLLLRLSIETDQPFFKAVRFKYNMASQISMIGLAYFIIASIALMVSNAARKTMALFLIAAGPYIIAILMVSSPREIRIWAPVLMPMIILQFQAEMETLAGQRTQTAGSAARAN